MRHIQYILESLKMIKYSNGLRYPITYNEVIVHWFMYLPCSVHFMVRGLILLLSMCDVHKLEYDLISLFIARKRDIPKSSKPFLLIWILVFLQTATRAACLTMFCSNNDDVCKIFFFQLLWNLASWIIVVVIMLNFKRHPTGPVFCLHLPERKPTWPWRWPTRRTTSWPTRPSSTTLWQVWWTRLSGNRSCRDTSALKSARSVSVTTVFQEKTTGSFSSMWRS